MEKLYKITGGGFYRYTLNNRTKRGEWIRKDVQLKRTERDTFAKEEAAAIVEKLNHAFIKMSNIEIMEA